jgi:5-methylcytosine-specific restriction protein B
MESKLKETGARACWFVGATFGSDDQAPRFIAEEIWENGYEDKYLDTVRSIQPGERMAIKATYTRKHDLPFDNRGHTVSVMAIKAVGTVTENPGDGRIVKVDWRAFDTPREWYFYTYLKTIWRVLPGDWANDALIGFAFEGKPQDLDRFRNRPFWRERFGDETDVKKRFKWTRFYEAVAEKLAGFREKRGELVAGIHAIAARVEGLSNLQDQFADGSAGPLKDICPFTAMGIFNRGITDANRKIIAAEMANFLDIHEPVPQSFEGIPILNNLKSWFFGFEKNRRPEDIDVLWEIFAQAMSLAASADAEERTAFADAYDRATEIVGVGWNLTMGLYWIRPWNYPTLDSRSRIYIEKKLLIQIGFNGLKGLCSANDYFTVLDALETRFQEEHYPVHSFPELSLAAWLYKDGGTRPKPDPAVTAIEDEESGVQQEEDLTPAPLVPYSVDSIMSDGCFFERFQVETFLARIRMKKNLILQGPPGTGKTWLSKRLAYALIGERNDSKVRAVQFHPNLSYEDFVRGFRPAGDGKLSLMDGPFMEMVNAASKDPQMGHVIIIEEINRGNPAQIFGEMLTLLEADKRTPDGALELCYRRIEGEQVYIPGNLYVIGTMNIADRSLALVDLALRRRFAFVDLEPKLGKPWHDWVQNQCGIDTKILSEIENRILALNEEIAADTSLGSQFRIGHSYVTPPAGAVINDSREWFRQVVETEIGPLLDEYWFDALNKAKKARQQLLEGF